MLQLMPRNNNQRSPFWGTDKLCDPAASKKGQSFVQQIPQSALLEIAKISNTEEFFTFSLSKSKSESLKQLITLHFINNDLKSLSNAELASRASKIPEKRLNSIFSFMH